MTLSNNFSGEGYDLWWYKNTDWHWVEIALKKLRGVTFFWFEKNVAVLLKRNCTQVSDQNL